MLIGAKGRLLVYLDENRRAGAINGVVPASLLTQETITLTSRLDSCPSQAFGYSKVAGVPVRQSTTQ
jgi:hypothetical protein